MASDAAQGRAAILAPGGAGSADVPLLSYAGLAVRRRGGHVHPIAWNAPVDWDARHDFVAVRVAAALDEVTAATGVTAPVLRACWSVAPRTSSGGMGLPRGRSPRTLWKSTALITE